MSSSFDPSPRASKRQRVAKSGQNDVTPQELQEVSQDKTQNHKARATPRNAHEDGYDSAYASKEDSLVEDMALKTKRAGTAFTRSNRKSDPHYNASENDAAPGKSETTPMKRKASQKHANMVAKAGKSSSAKSKNSQLNDVGIDTPENDQSVLSLQDTSDEEQQNELEASQPRSSGRQRRRPRRFSDAQEEQVGKKTASSEVKKRIQVMIPKRSQPVATSKGILTPTVRQSTASRKSVVFDSNEKEIEQQFGFKDIQTSTKKQKPKVPETVPSIQTKVSDAQSHDREEMDVDDEESFQMPVIDDFLEEAVDDNDDLAALQLQSELELEDIHDEDPPELSAIKLSILSRLTLSQLPPLVHLEAEYDALHALLSATITAGESNSLLVLGGRGVGKSLLIETALNDLATKHHEDFHTVRLDGFFQTDDRLALREIWRQLGREMHVSEDETGEISSYADTMASLLSLLSHPDELDPGTQVSHGGQRASKSVIFVLDEFDLFTTHPRQTLLYNLFDIAQSRKAPIAVIGCSTRMDVIECLEKRVKSRYSHRWFHVPGAKSLAAFEDIVRGTLLLDNPDSNMSTSTKQKAQWISLWNDYIKTQFLPSEPVQTLVSRVFYSNKSIPDVFATLYPAIATMQLSLPPSSGGKATHEFLSPSKFDHATKTSLESPLQRMDLPSSILPFLPTLPTLHLSLLTAATRLETIHSLAYVNFNLVYTHYTELIARSRLQQTASGAVAVGGAGLRQWGREVSGAAWEELARYGVIWAVTGAAKEGEVMGGGEGQHSRMYRMDVTLEEVEWAVKEKWPRKGNAEGTGEVLVKWCREI